MANIYVRNAGSNTSPYDTWAKAATTLAVAATASTNADTIWVADDHSESQVTAMTVTFPTSAGLKVLCANTHATEPPTGLATTAQVAVGAGSVALNLNGFAYIYGVQFLSATNNSSAATMVICQNNTAHGLYFDNCLFHVRSSNTSVTMFIGNASASGNAGCFVSMSSCTVKFGSTAHSISLRNSLIHIRNLAIDSTGSTPTTLFKSFAAGNCDVLVESSDLTGEAFTNLIDSSAGAYGHFTFRNCKIPGSVTMSTGTIPNNSSCQTDIYNCDSADTNYRFSMHRYAGTIINETTVIKSGGASDGTTGISWKMATNASSAYPMAILSSPEIVIWNDTTGSAKTVTVEIVHDSQGAGTGSRFTNNQLWLEVNYLGTSGFPQGSFISDGIADVLATPADQADSSATWTTTGLASPLKQALSVTFTPQEKGYIHAKVMMSSVSKTCYVDPVLTIS